MIEKPNKKDCPVFDDFADDYNVDRILEWSKAEVYFCTSSVDSEGNEKPLKESLHHWGFSWPYGFISFFSARDEKEARIAAALFIHLWCNGIAASLADKLAEGYIIRNRKIEK